MTECDCYCFNCGSGAGRFVCYSCMKEMIDEAVSEAVSELREELLDIIKEVNKDEE